MAPLPRSRFRRLAPRAMAAFLLAGAAACASGDEENYVERPAEEFYAEAERALAAENYDRAAELFNEVERQHPYSPAATKAQLMAAYASYEGMDYDDAIIALDRFIQLHPGHEDIAYAYYLKALSYYERISDVERDQGMTELAMEALNDVAQRFPDTTYGRDARLKLDLTRDQLAGKEMEIGRWYLRQNEHNAAINRFLNVVKNYETTTHVPEALHRLTEAYLALGLTGEAQAAAAVLGHNYPGSEWYVDSYALLVDASVRPPDDRTLLGRALDTMF